MEPPPIGGRRHRPTEVLPSLALATFVFPTLWLPPVLGLQVLGLAVCLWSGDVLIRRGGPYLTPSAVFALAAGIFLGIGCLMLAGDGPTVVTWYQLRDAAALAVVTTALADLCRTLFVTNWKVSWPTRAEVDRGAGRWSTPPPLFSVKAVALVALALVPVIISLGDATTTGLGLGGSIMAALGASTVRHRIKWAGDAALVLLAWAVPAFWISRYFTGGGRLLVAGLGIAVIAGWNLTRPRRVQKAAVVLAIPIFIIVSGQMRHDAQQADERRTAQESGLESMYIPVDTFAEVLWTEPASGESIGPRWGATFVNTATMPIPRSMWEGKPKGFGAELTEHYRPYLSREGHSMAGLLHSEAFANFGWVGIAALPVVLGYTLGRLDRWHARLVYQDPEDPARWWSAAVLMCVIISLSDLLWVGTFTFYARGGFAALVVAVVGRMSVSRQARTMPEAGSFEAHRGGTGAVHDARRGGDGVAYDAVSSRPAR